MLKQQPIGSWNGFAPSAFSKLLSAPAVYWAHDVNFSVLLWIWKQSKLNLSKIDIKEPLYWLVYLYLGLLWNLDIFIIIAPIWCSLGRKVGSENSWLFCEVGGERKIKGTSLFSSSLPISGAGRTERNTPAHICPCIVSIRNQHSTLGLTSFSVVEKRFWPSNRCNSVVPKLLVGYQWFKALNKC